MARVYGPALPSTRELTSFRSLDLAKLTWLGVVTYVVGPGP